MQRGWKMQHGREVISTIIFSRPTQVGQTMPDASVTQLLSGTA